MSKRYRDGRIPPVSIPIQGNNTVASTSATDSAASSDVLFGEYDVFLSFCGADTRKGFADVLYNFLDCAGVRTFRDNEGLHVGKEIGPELLKAIKDSKILIPIFSKNYASSKWCLMELAHMAQCQAEGEQMIFPIFYDVDPHDVRNQHSSYEKAFHEHKDSFDAKTIQGWKKALTKVGKLKGLELIKETDGREGELAKIIVEKVLQFLKKNYIHVPKNLVGMDNHIEKLKGLLKVDSNGLRIVGIHGMGGLGKTTIAKVIYNQLCEHFDGHCFLDDVREKSRPRDGIVKLQKQLISKILKREMEFNDAYEGSNIIKTAVRSRKVLIVLDDVDESLQVEGLMGDQSWFGWFGAQSRIIITTRDTRVLDAVEMACQSEDQLDVYRSYKPNLMDTDHSLQLFSKYAFRRDSPMGGSDIFSKKVVSIAGGLPLVLVVLGSAYFTDKYKDLWEEKLRKLSVIPHDKVLEKLRICFEALSEEQKQIFLDIACLFIGCDKTIPSYMWDDCKFFPGEGIRDLVSRSLITVGDDNVLRMHDQLRDLGRQIVREEGLNEPGKRSRLWDEDEVIHVLKTRQGTENVKGLRVDGRWDRKRLVEEDFRKLPNLWYLNLFDILLDGDFKDCLPNLRWLQLRGYYGNFAPRNLLLKNLVILDMSFSNITDDWEGWSLIKRSKKLKVLNIYRCRNLSRVPYLSTFWMLERLHVRNCSSLSSLDGIEGLEMLRYLDASFCFSLERLPNLSKLSKLGELSVSGCDKLVEIQGLEKLESLEVLSVGFCEHLKRLPNLSNLKRLKTLDVASCELLLEIPGLTGLESLEHLDMSCISTERLPDLSNLKRLRELNASACCRLMEIQGVEGLESLERLILAYCRSIKRLPVLSNLKSLKCLNVRNCDTLIEIPGLEELESLERLDLSGCISIKRLPVWSNLKSLKSLDVSYCDTLIEIPGLEELESLELLHIVGCKSIEKLPDFSNLKKLILLDANGCKKLIEVTGLDKLESLTYLDVRGCYSLEFLLYPPKATILCEDSDGSRVQPIE